MRNMLCVLVLALVATPMFAVAGDTLHHGHGYKSGWDSQTGDGPQGSEWVTAPPPIRDFHDGRYYNRGHYGYQDYYPHQYPVYYTPTYSRRSEVSIGYNNGNWSASYRNAPSYNYYPAQGYYPPNNGYQPYPAYQYPVVQPVYPPVYQQQTNYQDYQRYPSAPIYSAPANPDLGYYAQPVQPQQQPQVVNIYNYYNEEFANVQQPAAPVVQQPGLQARPAAPVAAPEPARAFGTRFYNETLLQTDAGLTYFTLDGAKLFVGPDNGPPTLVAENVDPALGVLALYQEGLGISLVYKSGGQLMASSQVGNSWIVEPCPVAVDFHQEVSLGVLGGSAWIVAIGLDGNRYVLSYSGGIWQEIGSGTTAVN